MFVLARPPEVVTRLAAVGVLGALCGLATGAHAAPCPPDDVFNQLPHVTGNTLAFCDGSTRSCWALDVPKGTWSTQPMATEATVSITPTEITACAADGKTCKKLATAAYADGGTGVASDDLALLAVYRGPTVDIYDLDSSKRLTTIKGWKSPMGPAKDAVFQGAKFVGKTLVVWESWTPVSSAARLYEPRKARRIADLVKAGTEVEPWAVALDDKVWLFAGFDPKLYLVDVTTGKLKKTIKLAGGQNGKVIAGKLSDGRVAIVSDGVILVDPVAGTSSPVAAPHCTK